MGRPRPCRSSRLRVRHWPFSTAGKWLAALPSGLLLLKPQFGLVLAIVVLGCREWSILIGLTLSAAVQATAVVSLLGRTALLDYLHVLPRLAGLRGALEPRTESMQSIAAVTGLLPGLASTIAWLIASAAVCWVVVRVWRCGAPVPVRAGALVMGSMLVNPHVNLYDAAVLGPSLLSLSGWLEAQDERWADLRHRWHLALYALYALLLFPTGKVIGLQLSPFVLLWMTHAVWRVTRESDARTASRSAVLRDLQQHG